MVVCADVESAHTNKNWKKDYLAEDFLVEDGPIFKVIEIYCARIDRAIVGKTTEVEDPDTGGVIVDIAADGHVVFVDACIVQGCAWLGLDPRFKLRVAGLGGKEGADGFFVEAEGGDDHAVVPAPDAGVFGVKFASGLEGGFLPEARKVNGAERAGDFGADSWDVVTHGSCLGVLDWIKAVDFAIKNAKSLRHAEPLISYGREPPWQTKTLGFVDGGVFPTNRLKIFSSKIISSKVPR